MSFTMCSSGLPNTVPNAQVHGLPSSAHYDMVIVLYGLAFRLLFRPSGPTPLVLRINTCVAARNPGLFVHCLDQSAIEQLC